MDNPEWRQRRHKHNGRSRISFIREERIMHLLLTKLLTKRGIKDKENLSTEEKKDFERWEKILSGGEVTVEKISRFCEAQIQAIETQWKNLDNDTKKNERLTMLHVVYSTIKKAINAPQVERVTFEEYLNQLILT